MRVATLLLCIACSMADDPVAVPETTEDTTADPVVVPEMTGQATEEHTEEKSEEEALDDSVWDIFQPAVCGACDDKALACHGALIKVCQVSGMRAPFCKSCDIDEMSTECNQEVEAFLDKLGCTDYDEETEYMEEEQTEEEEEEDVPFWEETEKAVCVACTMSKEKCKAVLAAVCKKTGMKAPYCDVCHENEESEACREAAMSFLKPCWTKPDKPSMAPKEVCKVCAEGKAGCRKVLERVCEETDAKAPYCKACIADDESKECMGAVKKFLSTCRKPASPVCAACSPRGSKVDCKDDLTKMCKDSGMKKSYCRVCAEDEESKECMQEVMEFLSFCKKEEALLGGEEYGEGRGRSHKHGLHGHHGREHGGEDRDEQHPGFHGHAVLGLVVTLVLVAVAIGLFAKCIAKRRALNRQRASMVGNHGQEGVMMTPINRGSASVPTPPGGVAAPPFAVPVSTPRGSASQFYAVPVAQPTQGYTGEGLPAVPVIHV